MGTAAKTINIRQQWLEQAAPARSVQHNSTWACLPAGGPVLCNTIRWHELVQKAAAKAKRKPNNLLSRACGRFIRTSRRLAKARHGLTGRHNLPMMERIEQDDDAMAATAYWRSRGGDSERRRTQWRRCIG